MTTIVDVARRAGVSKATASRALSGAAGVSPTTRRSVLEAAEALGYRASGVAVRLATGRHGAIGAVVPLLDQWYFATLVAGLAEASADAGLDLMVAALGSSERTDGAVARFTHERRVDGIVLGCVPLPEAQLDRLGALAEPVCGVGIEQEGLPRIGLDDIATGGVLAEHLLSLGHRAIAIASSENELAPWNYDSSRNRVLGAAAAFAAARVAPAPVHRLPASIVAAREAAVALLARERPTAILATTDEIGAGIVLAAAELGIRVPEQLSVVGVDDHPFGAALGLTTVRQDPHEQGRAAVSAILGALDGIPMRPRLDEPVLLVRGTTAPPR